LGYLNGNLKFSFLLDDRIDDVISSKKNPITPIAINNAAKILIIILTILLSNKTPSLV